MRTVLFDFDGVLVRGDAFGLYLRRRALVGWRRMPALAVLPVVAVLMLVPRQRPRAARLLSRIGLLGRSPVDLRRQLADFGRSLAGEPGRVLPGAVAAAREHLPAGDRVVVVTACEQTVARAVLDAVGLTGVELVGSCLDGPAGAVHNHGPQKLIRLAAHGIEPPWDVAYSDSLSDLPLLRGAERPVMVNGRARAVARARAILGDRLTVVTWTAPSAPRSAR